VDRDRTAFVERLIADRPSFHSLNGDEVVWSLANDGLRMIARLVAPGDVTLECGSGASTVVFVAAGARHTAVSPAPDEHARIRAYLKKVGLEDRDLSCIAERSEDAFPTLQGPFDVVLVDGLHAFPHPILDWQSASRLLRVDGIMILDDVNIPTVAVLRRFMASDPTWELIGYAGDRVAAFRKVAEPAPGDPWYDQPFNRRFDYSFVAWPRSWYLAARGFIGRLADEHPRLVHPIRGGRGRS
jgi:SAM-dependent methyltransferase